MKNKFLIILVVIFYSCKKELILTSGQELYQLHACHTCHSLDGSRMIGPSFKGLYNREVQLNGGISKIADDNYLIESILNPSKEIVKGFPNLMGSYKMLLNEREVDTLIDFI